MVTILHHNVKGALVSYLPPSNHELFTKICDKEITNFFKDISFQCTFVKSQVEQLKVERKVQLKCISKVRLLKWKFLYSKKIIMKVENFDLSANLLVARGDVSNVKIGENLNKV
jgi:hypothetical protein